MALWRFALLALVCGATCCAASIVLETARRGDVTAYRTVVLVADKATTVTELERLSGAYDHSEIEVEGSAAARLMAALDSPGQRHLSSTATLQELMDAASKLGPTGVACQSQRCPKLFTRAARREAGSMAGIGMMALQLRGANVADSAASAVKAVQWARASDVGWRVWLTTESELNAAAGSAFSLARNPGARALQAGVTRLSNVTETESGIAMSPTVLMMLTVMLVCGLAVAGMVSCAVQIQTPSRFALQPLRSGKVF